MVNVCFNVMKNFWWTLFLKETKLGFWNEIGFWFQLIGSFSRNTIEFIHKEIVDQTIKNTWM